LTFEVYLQPVYFGRHAASPRCGLLAEKRLVTSGRDGLINRRCDTKNQPVFLKVQSSVPPGSISRTLSDEFGLGLANGSFRKSAQKKRDVSKSACSIRQDFGQKQTTPVGGAIARNDGNTG